MDRARLARLLRSRRFWLLAAASVAAVVSLFLDGWLATSLAAIAIVLTAVLLLAIGNSISSIGDRVGKVSRTGGTQRPRPSRDEEEAEESAAESELRSNRMSAAIAILDLDESSAGDSGPTVTVVIPCFNEERFIEDAIESVRRQTFQNWECVVVDDASTDGSLLRAWEASKDDRRIRVLRHRVNGGLGAARNTGLRAANARFVTFLDSDDLLMHDSLLERVTALAEALDDPHVIGSYCGVRVEVEEFQLDDLRHRKGRNEGGVIDFITADAECPFNAHAPLLLTERLRDLGGFDENMRHGAEDWDLWYRAMRNGYVFVPAKSVTAIYRQKRTSMVRTMPDGHTREADRLISAAYLDADPGVFTAPTPTPFSGPLAAYRERLQKARRAVRFAVMALVRNDEQAARNALTTVSELPLELIRRHLDVDDLVGRGMMRVLAVRHDELRQFGTTRERITGEMWGLIREISAAGEEITPRVSVGFVGVLLPQHPGQVPTMVRAAAEGGLAPGDLAIVDFSRETGSSQILEKTAGDMEVFSLNEWLLGGQSATRAYVPVPRVGAIDLLARRMTEGGSTVLEVTTPLSQVMTVDAATQSVSPASTAFSLTGGTDSGVDTLDVTAAWVVEEYPETWADKPELVGLRDRHKGERVVIIGNGPSLNECDLSLLANENTIAVNGIFYASERMGFDPTYYVVEDTAVMRDNLEEIRSYQAGHRFFPSIYRHLVGDLPNTTFFMMNRGFYEASSPDFCIPRFTGDPSQGVFSGQSVTIINLQLAYWLGYSEVILIGMDFSYTIPDSAERRGDVITSTESDPNHFHPDYFGAGKVWKDPKLDRVLANYALAKEIYEADGRRIVNATVGGKLELFDRVDYVSVFRD